MTDDDVCGNRSSPRIAQCTDRVTKLIGVDLTARFSLPLIGIRFESKKKRFETSPYHKTRNFRRDKARIKRIGSVERQPEVLPQHSVQKREKNVIRPEEQC